MTSTEQKIATRHQTPTSIRDETFPRRMFGIDADHVYEYLDLLADQVQATERELTETRDENERLRARLASVQAELDEYEQVGERVNEQVVQLFSQAQLVAEEMVEDVSRDARERLGHARAHEQRIVSEAVDTAGEQVRSYARSARAQMESVMESFASEVDRLGSPTLSRESQPEAPAAYDPLVDDLADWQIAFRGEAGGDASGRA
jgi:cell division septum initiation protein DivIVA